MTHHSKMMRLVSYLLLVAFFHTSFIQATWAASPWARSSKPVVQKTEDESQNAATEAMSDEPAKTSATDLNLKPADVPAAPEFSAEAVKQSSEKRREEGMRKNLPNSNTPVAAVLDVYSTALSGPEIYEIYNSFRREVKNTGRFLVYNKSEMKKALSKNLDQEIVAARQIDEYVSQARKLYDDFKFDAAAAIMKQAMTAIAAFDASPSVSRKISEAYLTQGLISEAQGRDKDADVAFLNAAALDPDRQLDPTRYPPNVIAKFYKSKSEFAKIKKGTLRIETNPPVARVVVGEKEFGTTPTSLKDLPLGVQKITLVKKGYEAWEKNVMVVASAPDDFVNKLDVSLGNVGGSISLDALIGEVVSKKDYESQILKLSDVGKLLLADTVFAARIEKGESGYDLFMTEVEVQSGREVAKAYAQIDPALADVDVSMAHALSDLMAGKAPAKTAELIAVEGKGSHYLASYKKNKSFFKSWPFYLLLGLAVAGGGAGAAMALTGSDGAKTGSATIAGPPQP